MSSPTNQLQFFPTFCHHLARTYGQSRWEYLFSPGLIDTDEAEELADQVWKEDVEEDEDDLLNRLPDISQL